MEGKKVFAESMAFVLGKKQQKCVFLIKNLVCNVKFIILIQIVKYSMIIH
jgi:hypothetical protein